MASVESDAKVREFVEKQLIPPLTNILGKSGPASFTTSVPESAFFISDVFLLDVKFNGDAEATRLVVKRCPYHENSEMFEPLFDNEILFYTELAGHYRNRVPKCYHARSSGRDSFLAIENVSPLGYALCPKSFDLDWDYVTVSIKEIAEFHSAGYIMREKQPDKFRYLVGKVRVAKFDEKNERFGEYVNIMSLRGMKYLRSVNYDPEFCDIMETVLGDAFRRGILESLKPEEPLATICHGDFLRNNILYRGAGKNLEAMLIDFATIMYTSPAIDLSTFFYLSCSRSDMVNRFDEIFGLYCDTLRESLKAGGIKNLEEFSYKALLEDYKRKAIVGYIIANFFLAVLIYGSDPEATVDDFFSKSVEEYASKAVLHGGEEMDKLLAEMLLDMRKAGCLDRFLK